LLFQKLACFSLQFLFFADWVTTETKTVNGMQRRPSLQVCNAGYRRDFLHLKEVSLTYGLTDEVPKLESINAPRCIHGKWQQKPLSM